MTGPAGGCVPLAEPRSAAPAARVPETGKGRLTAGGLLVGREGDVGSLAAAVRDLGRGRGRSVWVEGEPGIGKSAVLAAGLAGAEQLGCQVFRVAAGELSQRFPLRVMLDCLGVRESTDPYRREIVELLHGDRPLAGPALADPVPPATERLLALVDRLCAAAPVLLVVDDLHWADEASLLVWHRLAQSVRQLPLLLVGACRPVPRRPELVQIRRGIAASDAILISLRPLSAVSAEEMVCRLLGIRSVGPGLRRAAEQAAGNPLYLRELVDALNREGRLRLASDTADLVEDRASGAVPLSLAAAISDRLRFVSGQTLGMLRAATLLDSMFSVADLSVVTGGSVVELATAVEEAMAAGVLVESGLRLAFRHGLIRQALSDGTPPAARLALHRAAARALVDAGAAVERVAEQLLAAAPESAAAVVEDWVLDWLLGSGRALAHRMPHVAADLLARAVEGAQADDPRRDALQASLASVLVLLGRREEAGRLAQRVLDSTHDPTRAAEMSWTLGWALGTAQRYDQARAVLDRALNDPSTDRVWAARLRALRSRVAAGEGDLDEATRTAEQALAEADQAGDPLAAASALFITGMVLVFRGDPAGAIPVYSRALGLLGEETETADLRLSVLVNQMDVLATLDRMDEAAVAVRELLATAERSAAPPRLASVRIAAAEFSYLAGRWDGAWAELEAAADPLDQLATRNQRWLHGLAALIACRRGDQASAEAHLAAIEGIPSRDPFSGPDFVLMAQAVRAEQRGHPEQALALLTELLDPARADELGEQRAALPDIVRLALAVGDGATARTAAEAGTTLAGTEPTRSQDAADRHCRGLLDGDPEQLRAAADIYRSVGRPVQLAHALEDAAVVLAQREDLRGARAAHAEAVEIYTGLGADWDLLRLATRLRPYGLRRPSSRRRPATGWDALTATEQKVAHLVAAGNSNPDIAADLFLSRRTVEVHVSHILAKLGARSRIDVARVRRPGNSGVG